MAPLRRGGGEEGLRESIGHAAGVTVPGPMLAVFLAGSSNLSLRGEDSKIFPEHAQQHDTWVSTRGNHPAGDGDPPGHRHPPGRGEEVCPDVPRLVGAPGGSRGPRGRGWNPRRSLGVGGKRPGAMGLHIPESDRIGGIGHRGRGAPFGGMEYVKMERRDGQRFNPDLNHQLNSTRGKRWGSDDGRHN